MNKEPCVMIEESEGLLHFILHEGDKPLEEADGIALLTQSTIEEMQRRGALEKGKLRFHWGADEWTPSLAELSYGFSLLYENQEPEPID